MADIEEMIEEGRIISMEARIDELQLYADEARENGLGRDEILADLQDVTGLSYDFLENNVL